MTAAPPQDVPRLAVTDPSFSITGDEVKEARERSWYARTEYGLAVLRYAEASELLKHASLRQGSAAWPAHNGITEGPFARWFDSWVLNKEGEEHHRLTSPPRPGPTPRCSRTWSSGPPRPLTGKRRLVTDHAGYCPGMDEVG